MLCNRKKSSLCLLLLVALLGAILAGCGGDEPAPAPPPPPPPPPPAFVPKDVSIELGTSGETITLQTTESGGFTRNGEAFASGTTVEATGNTYRLVLQDGEWAAEYVAPRPWVTALGRSGDAVLITRAENGFYEVGEGDDKRVFASGGTLEASNGNEYRLTLNEDTNSWQVEYVPPEPDAVALGMSGETVLVERLEGGGYSVGGQRVADGSTVRSASGTAYRLSMQDGAWTATFVPPPPVSVPLGQSGQTVTLQIGEDGNYYKGDQLYISGSTESTADGTIYTLTLQNGMWSATALSKPIVVSLGELGGTITLMEVRTEDGFRYERDGQTYEVGSTVRARGNTYRLVLQDGELTGRYEPRTVVVALGTSGETVILRQVTEDGSRFETLDGRTYVSGTSETTSDGTRFEVVLRNGVWDAIADRGETIRVRLGERGGTITLLGYSNGDLIFNGEPFTSGRAITSPENGSEYIVTVERRDDGTWDAVGRFRPQSERVRGADGQLLLFRQEDGSYIDTNGDRVQNGDIITYKGERYELLESATQGWIATPIGSAPTTEDQVVALPDSAATITLTRTSTGTYTYEGNTVSNGSQITVGQNRYVLTQDSDGNWSARATTTPPTINPGTVGGPTQTDVVDPFTADTDHFDTATVKYGVQFTKRGVQTLSDRGTRIVPLKLLTADPATTISGEINSYEFPVYELMQQALVSQERTFVEVAKAKLEDIVSTIQLRRDEYAADTLDPDTDIAGANRLWQQAKDAVGRIFGYAAGSTETGRVLGANPWKGQRLDVDEVDAVVEALQDTIAVLSDSARFAREFENQIADVNEGPDNTPNTNDDLGYSARDFFDGDMYRIRFGSTGSTRFGAYAVKKSTTSVTAHAAIDGMWEPGVFAYTPSDEPNAGDIPSRGEATFRGDTVAVLPGTPETTAENGFQTVDLFAGKIELVASFTRKRVSGTVTELKDEGGNTFEYDGGFGKEAVRSISLASAHLDPDDPGLYKQAAATDEATLFFEDNLPSEPDITDTAFTVQLVEEATEALGVWKAFGLEGSFGATRTGSVGKPTLPAEADRGGKAVLDSIHVITDGVAAASGAATSAIINPDNDDNSELTLIAGTLGLAPGVPDSDLLDAVAPPVVTQVEFDREFPTLKLRDLYSSRTRNRRSSDTITTKASAEILKVRNLLEHDSSMAGVEAILTTYLGLSGLDLAGKVTSATATITRRTGESDASLLSREQAEALRARRAVADAVRNALGSDSSFKTALAANGIFTPSNGAAVSGWDDDRISRARTERRWDFALRFAKTKYTRFGVWSQMAPQTAGAVVDHEEGSFAYSPLAQPSDISLSFAAKYSGTTLAVNEKTGHLYSGRFDLSVNWQPDSGNPPIRSTITDLKGVHGTSAYFKHDNKDVRSLFFTGFTVAVADGTFTAANATVRVNYRTGSSRNVDLTSSGEMAGTFVMDSTYEDEPVGVLGVWSIPEVSGMNDAFTGSFGADLVP